MPGSIDIDEKQIEQCNLTAPPLYLWSRRDWTAKHRNLALEKGHISGTREVFASDGENLSAGSKFINRDEEIIASPGPLEPGRSLGKRMREENLSGFGDKGVVDESSDMDISPPHADGHGSTIGVDENLNKTEDTEKSPESAADLSVAAHRSCHEIECQDSEISQTELTTTHDLEDISGVVQICEGALSSSALGGFAPGLLPEAARQGLSCGWIDD